MITIESATPSPDSTFPPTLAALSRNASAISTSSSDSTPSAPFLTPRPRPIRTFSGPRSRSPHSLSPRGARPPHYLARELGYFETEDQARDAEVRAKARSQSRSRNAAVTVEDFRFGKTLGVGSYSTVKLATHLASARVFAIKVIDKGHLIAKKKQQTALAEKDVLKRLGAGHPGIVRMWYTFQDQWCLYFVLDLAKNGEMKILLNRMGSLSLECSRYYSAQLVDIIRYMHSKNVIHRDLKPENLLLDADFRIKLTDFGTGKVLDDDVDKANTWVGTAQYIAPELLSSKETSKATDFWALGCIIYQMISGRFAFQGLSEFLTFEKIKKLEYSFPDGFDESPKDLVQRLLVRDPSARLGVGPPGSEIDFDALTSHPFFASIVWEMLWTSQPPALEAGLMKNDNPLAQGHDGNWEGITAAWDDLLADDEDDDEEELEWASDARGPRHQLPQTNGYHGGFDIGPMDEIRPHKIRNHSRRGTGSTVQGHERETSSAVGITQGRRATSESPFSGSPSSSSEGSPVRNLDTMMESMDLRVSQNPTTSSSVESPIQEEDERGRKQALSPIQGNGPASNVDL
ncbi:kinase-like domain-containing protein [Crucibulum laeve]|uniref:non-specific serine/threonine protein kinase n=1 Tax=Crucibulum laeve TaxID=68775 RepID=A0A5C3MH58_9AGAR|nr:kinase-like domain-containing protein [Crucibulum laeve]